MMTQENPCKSPARARAALQVDSSYGCAPGRGRQQLVICNRSTVFYRILALQLRSCLDTFESVLLPCELEK